MRVFIMSLLAMFLAWSPAFASDRSVTGSAGDSTAGDMSGFEDARCATWRVLARLGDADSQYRLGRCYLKGKGIPADPKEALFWFDKAARAGHLLAQRVLATLYFSGIGVRKSPAHALRWFRRAAEKGDVVSQVAVADLYYRGIGLRRPDYKRAWYWMMAAARQGDPAAQYRVGLMFRDGLGTRVNLSRAFLWLHVAALNTTDEAMKARILERRDEVARHMGARLLAATKRQEARFVRRYTGSSTEP